MNTLRIKNSILYYTVNIKNSKDVTFCTISALPSEDYIYVEWIGFVNEIEASKIACRKVVDFIERSGKILLLNDNRKQTGPWPPIEKWLGEVWIPAMRNAGLKMFAHLYSPSYFTELSAKTNLRDTVGGIEFGHFNSEEDAKGWLANQDEALPKV
ncbi:MAG: hypothetical protein ACFB15_31070 [Cyclobacteriaceae bacterium]